MEKKANNSAGRSVGAIVKRGEEFLVQYRLQEPRGLAMPAGHVDEEELPEEAAERELLEETSLRAKNCKLLWSGFVPVGCGKSHDGHYWDVFGVEAEGEPELREPEKHAFVKFMTIEEMRSYIEKRDYDAAWFEHILPALGII